MHYVNQENYKSHTKKRTPNQKNFDYENEQLE